MTDMEKRTILTMRKNGKSYAAIAKELSIPVGTIKTICSREKNTDTNTNTGVLCLTCGAPIQMNPNGKEKRFCSQHCYNKWWHANHTDLQHLHGMLLRRRRLRRARRLTEKPPRRESLRALLVVA